LNLANGELSNGNSGNGGSNNGNQCRDNKFMETMKEEILMGLAPVVTTIMVLVSGDKGCGTVCNDGGNYSARRKQQGRFKGIKLRLQ